MTDTAGGYATTPVNARLAVALTGVERLLDTLSVRIRELHELIEHLWQWATVDEATFDSWIAFDSPLRSFALGRNEPDVELLLSEAWPPLVGVVVSLVEVVEGNLYAAVNESETQGHFNDVLTALSSRGIPVPPPASVSHWPRSRFKDWGDPLSGDELVEWRKRLGSV